MGLRENLQVRETGVSKKVIDPVSIRYRVSKGNQSHPRHEELKEYYVEANLCAKFFASDEDFEEARKNATLILVHKIYEDVADYPYLIKRAMYERDLNEVDRLCDAMLEAIGR